MVKLADTYYTTSEGRVVVENDPDARFYIGPKGRELSAKQAARWGIDPETGEPSGEPATEQRVGLQPAPPEPPAPSEPPAADDAAAGGEHEKAAKQPAHKKREPEGDK